MTDQLQQQFQKFNIFMEFAIELLESSSSDESDQEIGILVDQMHKHPIPKIINYVENVVSILNDSQFKSHFRVKRTTCYRLVEQFARSEFYPSEHKGGSSLISAECHILSFLWYAGNNCTIRESGDRFNMSLSTFSSVQRRVMSFLLDLLPTVIRFPKTDLEKERVAAEFEQISGFPNILGCVDGSYINIRTPAHKIKSTYTNRHDIPSITLQGICDAKKKFLDVFTGPAGKLHDSRVFKLSFISSEIQTLSNNGHYHLIGDSAYPIRQWLLTPYRDYGNLTRQQIKYNKKLSSSRVKIENAFGLLKGRFRQLGRLDFHKVVKMAQFILCCCVLHNICIDYDDICEDIVNANEEDNAIGPDREHEMRRLGELKRQYICDLLNHE
ncbi:putative nuclease HARBI1 [Photinus pyralis]|uniref:putative nuclease HARBI1 n=1 Tax=Photinus pyralis TaxID=7054 RepID=UPI001267358B|nr:putative nuclease HARBI1 [Photinus pyralis]